MSIRSRLEDRHTAEWTLRGVSRAGGSSADPLVRLLAAAAAPGRAGELGGERSARAAFRMARLHGAAPPRTPASGSRTLHRMLVVKLAAVAATIAAASVAFAAGTGILPNPVRGRAVAPVGPASPTRPGWVGEADPSRSSTVDGFVPAPSPSLVGLCHAHLAGRPGELSTTSPGFADLVGAAGGADRVESFCAAVLEAERLRVSPEAGHGRTPDPKAHESRVPSARPSPPAPTGRR